MILVAVAVGAAGAADLPPLRAIQPPYFSADVAISVDSLGRPGVGVSVAIPYGELQWQRVPAGFAAGVEITVSLRPGRPGRLFGDVWSRRLAVATFVGTRAQGAAVAERRTFSVPPGRYRVAVSVRDLGSGVVSEASDALELPDYTRVPRGFSDLELGVVDSSGGFTAVPPRRFGLEVSRIAGRVALFDRRPGGWPRVYPFRYRILDDQGEELVAGTQQVSVSRSAEPILIRPSRSDLFIGDYVFQLELVEGRSRWRVERSFQVEESGPPRGRDLERLLEPLSYIAEPGEIERIRALPVAERDGAWDEFWRRRDPSPDTPRNEAMLEFFRRLRHADQRFQGFGPGWRSDMGRIYIRYGPPDQVESRPATASSVAVDVWYYNQPYRRFVFIDREGFGRYVLSPSTAE
jgi:GWxTD domain-containing protein